MATGLRRIAARLAVLLAAAVVAGCVSMGTTTGIETGDAGEPPRADGPVPAEFTAFVETLRPAAERAKRSGRYMSSTVAAGCT